ncbi:MAG: hypothetical protein KDE28_06100, partial [Anaerolineales bacterium]|nr:hypothetical protein [Anaerolineales bacterium]
RSGGEVSDTFNLFQNLQVELAFSEIRKLLTQAASLQAKDQVARIEHRPQPLAGRQPEASFQEIDIS